MSRSHLSAPTWGLRADKPATPLCLIVEGAGPGVVLNPLGVNAQVVKQLQILGNSSCEL